MGIPCMAPAIPQNPPSGPVADERKVFVAKITLVEHQPCSSQNTSKINLILQISNNFN